MFRLMFALSNAKEFGQYTRLRDNLMNGRSEAVEEFAAFSASHANAAEVLAHHGYVGSASKAKLVDLYWELMRAGAGQWVEKAWPPLTAIYDPVLLALLLKEQADGASSTRLASTALDFCERRVDWVNQNPERV
jgi:hypothetical protein